MRCSKPPSDEGGARRAEGEKITLQYRAEIYRTAFLIVRAHAALSLPLEGLAPAGAVSSATAMGGS